MSAGTKAAEKSGKKTACASSLSLSERLNAQRRQLLRVTVIVEDVGLGHRSLLVPLRKDGEIDQAKLAIVLADAATQLREVMNAFDSVLADQKACAGQAAP